MTVNITNSISDIVVNINSNDTFINLFNNFDDPFTTGKVANFKLREDLIGSGEINVLLFDQTGQGAPITVSNFLNYVNDGDYVNTIIHRSIVKPNRFIIQGGGFTVNNLQINNVPTDAPIPNEFSSNRSNTRGTIAMAKVDANPNSATNQWFFNLENNSSNLDNQNGGFTVFGEVLPGTNLTTMDAIASLPVFDATSINRNFTDLPVNIFRFDTNNPNLNEDDDFVRFENITVSNVPELTFTVESNTNPSVVNATVDSQGKMTLNYGNVLNTAIYRFQNENRPGTYLFVQEGERQNILNSSSPFVEEGLAFNIANSSKGDATTGNAQITVKATNLLGESKSDSFNVSVTGETQKVDDLVVFHRFNNTAVSGTYLYATEGESKNIEQNFPNFVKEGVAFYAYDANANKGVDFYRFQNSQQPGTYLFVGEEEKNNILATLPQFKLEGVAFEVAI